MIWLIYKLYFFYWQSELFRKILSSTKASTTIWLQKLFFKSALFKKKYQQHAIFDILKF